MRSLVHATIGGVSRGSVALVLSLRIFFVSTCCHPGIVGCVALALALAWLLLRDCGSLEPRSLLPGLWWRCRSGIARSCSPSRFPASVLVPGPWARLPRLSPSVRRLPWVGSTVGFLGSVSTSWESLVPCSVTFDSFSSLSSLHLSARALTEEWVGVLVWVFIHQPPCLLILQHGSQVGHTGSPSLLSYNLLFILQVSILSEQMVFLRKLKHIFPNTYQRINMMARLPPR